MKANPHATSATRESTSSQAREATPPRAKLTDDDTRFMQSLARGLAALEVIVRGGGAPVTAKTIADETGMSIGTARRCMFTLNATAFARANRNGAVPGVSLARIVSAYAATSPFIANCGPILDRARAALGITLSLITFNQTELTVVASSSQASLLKLDLKIGAALPLHCTSAGKVYLAGLDPKTLDSVLAEIDLTPHTQHTITQRLELRRQVAEVREQGYAISDQEMTLGVRTASVPLVSRRGIAVGAVSAAMLLPATGLRAIRSSIIPELKAAADELSEFAI